MRYLAAIAIAAFVAGAGLAFHSVGSLPLEKQSTPAQLATRLAESWIHFSIGPMANGRRDSKRIGQPCPPMTGVHSTRTRPSGGWLRHGCCPRRA